MKWRERVAAISYIPRFLLLAWAAHRGYFAGSVALRVFRSAFPLATIWVGKLIIDTVVAARAGHSDWPRLWLLVAIEMLLAFLSETLARASMAIDNLFGDLCSNHISEKLILQAATLDLQHFENPAFYDNLERAQRQTTGRIGVLAQILSGAQDALTFVSLAAGVFVYSSLLLTLLVLAVLPGFLAETQFASLEYALLYRLTPERRALDYFRYLSASDRTAKEVHVFGLARWLVRRFRSTAQRLYAENKRLAIRHSIVSVSLALVGLFGYYAAYAIILERAFYGIISIGTLTFLAASFLRSRDASQRVLLAAGNIYEQSLYLKDLFDFFEMKPKVTSSASATAIPSPIREGVMLENVSFRYPGSEAWALRNVCLRLAPGERIALVGENGAGKTTLTKLLVRLYDPSEGRILLDGLDLREYDLDSVRRAIGVIFQDFVQYDLRFDENIGVGEIDSVADYLEHPNGNASSHRAIVEAAEKSMAASLVPHFQKGYQQMLGRRFEGGVELSGGEWQKIALARAYIRATQILILDEPTAGLDARAENEVFMRFATLVGERTALLISHRFSTVRMADRIVVLGGGQVVEEGSHDQLLAKNGTYAEMFSLQAKGYR